MKRTKINLKILSKIPPIHKWKTWYFNKLDFKESKKNYCHSKTATFIQHSRYIMDFALVRRAILENQKVMWQLDGKNITLSINLEPAKHLSQNIRHSYNWIILANACKHARRRNNIDAIYIALVRHILSNQLKRSKVLLFRNGTTEYVIQKFSVHYKKYFLHSS